MTRTFFMMLILALQAPVGLAQGDSGAAETPSAPEPRRILISAGGGETASVLGAVARDLTGAALELGEGYQLTDDEDEAAWKVEVLVSGDGPWRLRVRAVPMNEMGERVTMKDSFGSRQELADALDRSVVELHKVWNEQAGEPPRLSPYLSGSEEAVDRFLEGLDALRSGRFSEADVLLSRALEADPDFDLASAELALLRSTAHAGADIEARRGGTLTATPPLPERILEDPHLVLGSALLGLSLSREDRFEDAVEPLARAAAAHPGDPRGQYWLGVALMATGDMDGAASSLDSAREGWPGLLRAYSLEAEALVRLREMDEARAVLNEMDRLEKEKEYLAEEAALHPGLMLGSLELLAGRFGDALDKFEDEARKMQDVGHYGEALHVLRTTIVEMRRDLVREKDARSRERKIEDAWEALLEYKKAVPEEVLESRPWEAMRFEGLNQLKEGNTIEAWRLIEKIKEYAAMPGYDDYYEAYLSAATMLKEGDLEGCAEQFKRAAAARSRVSDMMDVVMTQKQLKNNDEARRMLEEIERMLSRYDPSVPDHDDIILINPHLAALVPMYHYTWARLAFETGQPGPSRQHFSYMLKYLREPDETLMPLVKEAYGRGAVPQ